MVFDKASSWWSSSNEALQILVCSKNSLETSQTQLSLKEPLASNNNEHVQVKYQNNEDVHANTKNPWQIGVYQRSANESKVSEVATSRRSIRIKRLNLKYVDATIVEEDAHEPEFYKEAMEKPEWFKSIEEEVDALKQNQTWILVTKLKYVKPIS